MRSAKPSVQSVPTRTPRGRRHTTANLCIGALLKRNDNCRNQHACDLKLSRSTGSRRPQSVLLLFLGIRWRVINRQTTWRPLGGWLSRHKSIRSHHSRSCCLRSKSRPFFHSAGCEPNRTRHPRSSIAAMFADGHPAGSLARLVQDPRLYSVTINRIKGVF